MSPDEHPEEPTPEELAPEQLAPEDEARLRDLLHGLPEVAPPEGFFDDLIRRRRRRARLLAASALAAAGVAGGVAVAQATGIWGEAAPPMGDLASRHEVMVDVDPSRLEGAMEGDEVPAPYQAPEELAGMERGMAVRHPDDVVQVFYTRAGRMISVFEQAGEFDDTAMDAEMVPLRMRGVEAWQVAEDQIVVVRRDVVYVVVGDMATDELGDLVAELPDARPLGLVRRVRDAMDDLVTAFGFG